MGAVSETMTRCGFSCATWPAIGLQPVPRRGDVSWETMLVDTHSAYTLYVSGPIVVIIWHDAATDAIVTRLEQVLWETADACGEPITLVVVASFRAPIPSAEVRARIAQCFRRLGPRLRTVAQVVEGEGFWAAAARCVMAGINLLSRGSYQRCLFGTRAEALAWLEGRRGIGEIASVLG